MKTCFRILLPLLIFGPAIQAQAQNEMWRVAANQRIEEYRKGTFHITAQDNAGNPLPNTPVHVKMLRHAFGFGTAISGFNLSNSRLPEYREKVGNLMGDGRSFNMVTFGNDLKWPDWENSSSASKQQRVTQIAWLKSRGIQVRGHNLVWPDWRWMPADIQANRTDPAYIADRIESHIKEIVGYRGLKGNLRDWDVLNEPVHLTALRDVFKTLPEYTSGEEIYADWFMTAAEADPKAHLFINEYNIIAHYNSQEYTRQEYSRIIQNIIDAGAPLYGIGFQGHIRPNDPTTPENVYRALEQYAPFGKALAVTEYDFSLNNSQSECAKVDEQFAADYLRDFLTVLFSHPLAESFTMWGFWDAEHWRCDSPMFREDWSLKPSGQAFMDLVFGDWWTDETVTTDEQGEVWIKGFLGDYELSMNDGSSDVIRETRLGSNDTLSVVLSVRATAVQEESGIPQTIFLGGNYPNPFNPGTVIRYSLPSEAHVQLDIYDSIGRWITRPVDERQIQGWHDVEFEGKDLPSGMYYYRLTNGAETRVGKMLLAR